jgi:uncharacterized protein
MNKFIPEFDLIFMILGNGCNKQCHYCLQHPLVHKQLNDIEINKDIYTFISDIANRQQRQLRIQFFGGEPFIYWNGLVDVVNNVNKINETLDDNHKIMLSTFTNGTRFDDDKVKFLNDNKIHTTVSWDGRASEETRGYDVVKDEKIRQYIMNLKSVGFDAVLSAKCLPLEYMEDIAEVNAEYLEKNGYDLGFNMEEIMNTGYLDESEFCDFDYDLFEKQMQYLCDRYIDRLRGIGTDNLHFRFIDNLVNRLRWNINEKNQEHATNVCQNGYETLNMDLEGNLYYCHNCSDKAGDIYTPYLDYLRHIIRRDVTKERDKYCSSCPVQIMCNRACFNISDKEIETGSFCKVKRTLYQPIINMLLELGSQTTVDDIKKSAEENIKNQNKA